MMDKSTRNTGGVHMKKASSKTVNMQEMFENYPLIQNASTIKNMLLEMLNPKESERSSAKVI